MASLGCRSIRFGTGIPASDSGELHDGADEVGRFHLRAWHVVPTCQGVLAYVARVTSVIFVDPTGWKGAGMKHVARLVDRQHRDVIINFMYQYMRRFTNEQRRQWLIDQPCEFFGIHDATAIWGLNEEELIALYRGKL